MIEDEGWPRRVVELPADVRKTWGALDEKLYDLFPDAGDFEEGGRPPCRLILCAIVPNCMLS